MDRQNLSPTAAILICAIFLLGPIGGLAPLGFAPLLHATGAAVLITFRIEHGRWPVPRNQTTTALIVFFAYAALSCLWTSVPDLAWIKLLELAAIAAWSLIITKAISMLSDADRVRIEAAFPKGIAIGLACLLLNILLGFPLKQMGLHHRALPDHPIVTVDREIIALGLLGWPCALTLFARGHRIAAITGLVAYTIFTFLTFSHSAMVAMLGGLIVLGASYVLPICMRCGLITLCGIAAAFAIPVVFMLEDAGFGTMDSLYFSFRDRVQIWHFVAGRTLLHPFFGLGLEGSRAIPISDLSPGFLPMEHDKPPLHPHDIFLQLWLEFGAAGVFLAFVFMARLIDSIKHLDQLAVRFALPAATAFITVASVAFGIWQGWWLSLLGFLVALFMVVERKARPAP